MFDFFTPRGSRSLLMGQTPARTARPADSRRPGASRSPWERHPRRPGRELSGSARWTGRLQRPVTPVHPPRGVLPGGLRPIKLFIVGSFKMFYPFQSGRKKSRQTSPMRVMDRLPPAHAHPRGSRP